jgi:nicotinamide mononucleotide transporter
METILKILPFAAFDDAAQWLAFGLNLAYVVLAGRGNAWCWFFGFFGTIFQFIVCVDAELKSDAALQVYYALSAVYGWYSWQERNADGAPLNISRIPLSMHLKIGFVGATLGMALGFYWQSAAFRFEDALLAVFSVITTFLTARKVLESWLYWTVIDVSYALIYFSRDKYMLGVLSLIYFAFSIRGYILWRKSLKLPPLSINAFF